MLFSSFYFKNFFISAIQNNSKILQISQNEDNTYELKITQCDELNNIGEQHEDDRKYNFSIVPGSEISITIKEEEMYLVKKFLDVRTQLFAYFNLNLKGLFRRNDQKLKLLSDYKFIK